MNQIFKCSDTVYYEINASRKTNMKAVDVTAILDDVIIHKNQVTCIEISLSVLHVQKSCCNEYKYYIYSSYLCTSANEDMYLLNT